MPRKYFYINAQGQQMPPVDFNGLRNAGITADTPIWHEGLPDWKRAADIPELQSILAQTPPQYNQNGYSSNTQHPPTHLTLAIIATIFCFFPCGIVSIIYSSQVNDYWYQGRYDQARRASDKAKKWAYASIAITLGCIALAIILGLCFGLCYLFSV